MKTVPSITSVDPFRPGLAGAKFDDKAFSEVNGHPNVLYRLDQNWASARGNDWRAAWFGFIEGPYSGEVMISAEFEDGLELLIDGKSVINRINSKGRNKGSGIVVMTRGEKLPIALHFVTDNSKAFLKVHWQWEGSRRSVIPDHTLSFKLSELPMDLRFEFEYSGLENIQNWENFAPSIPALRSDQIDIGNAEIIVLQNTTILNKAAEMLADEILKRSRLDLRVSDTINDERLTIVIGTRDDMQKHGVAPPVELKIPEHRDGYAIWVDQLNRTSRIYLIGHDKRGALFATGRLLRLLDMGRDWAYLDKGAKISTAPVTPLRGHQMAFRPKTNSYDGWTIEMWEQYYRDMIVFGANAIELLPPRTDDALDSPHFPEPPLQMMVKMSQLAKDYGLDVWIWFPSMVDNYEDEEVLNAVLDEWAVVFKALPKIDAVFVPGGDPGNIHPSELFPFLQKQKRNLIRFHPQGQMWISPQGFDWEDLGRTGWLQDFYNLLNNEGPEWLDGVVFGPAVPTSLAELRKAIPNKYPIRRYPDITHSGSGQYKVENWDDAWRNTLGREPINPRPAFYAAKIRELQKYAIGFITYSEGCNDDVNKIVWNSLGWNPETEVKDILEEYSKYFIGFRYREIFAQGLAGLEKNWEGPLKNNESVYATLKLFQNLERHASPRNKLNWRFQQALYRAYYDAYVKKRLPFSNALESEIKSVLGDASRTGAMKAITMAEEIIDRPFHDPIASQWRARVYELAEALFQSVRMQLSVPRYGAIRKGRGATLDSLDAPLFEAKKMKREFMRIRMMENEPDRLAAIEKMLAEND